MAKSIAMRKTTDKKTIASVFVMRQITAMVSDLIRSKGTGYEESFLSAFYLLMDGVFAKLESIVYDDVSRLIRSLLAADLNEIPEENMRLLITLDDRYSIRNADYSSVYSTVVSFEIDLLSKLIYLMEEEEGIDDYAEAFIMLKNSIIGCLSIMDDQGIDLYCLMDAITIRKIQYGGIEGSIEADKLQQLFERTEEMLYERQYS